MGRTGIVVGGGASGLMAAISAAERGASVTILEHMPRVGKKLLSTGNGKCNLTNLFLDGSCYHCEDPEFPMRVVRQFSPADTICFFQNLGVVTTDRDGYVYPYSGQARTVLDSLCARAAETGVRMVTNTEISRLEKREDFFQADTSQGEFQSDFLILCAGSAAARQTGSDGSGYRLAQTFGHTVIKPLPALVQLRCEGGSALRTAAGVRSEAAVSLLVNGKLIASDRGEVQFTEYGLSGIPVFQVSRFASIALDRGQKVSAVLDLFPREKDMLPMLNVQRHAMLSRDAGDFLSGIFNKKLADLLLKKAGIKPDFPVRRMTKVQLRELASLIKSFEMPVLAVNSFEQAQTCAGGVNTSEVSSKTMESKLVSNLYFAGEILDVDGICGGYNLQWAWASGHLAGISAAEKGNVSVYD